MNSRDGMKIALKDKLKAWDGIPRMQISEGDMSKS